MATMRDELDLAAQAKYEISWISIWSQAYWQQVGLEGQIRVYGSTDKYKKFLLRKFITRENV